MTTIHLHNLIFFAHHGIHEEERKMGNQFEVNLDVIFEEPKNGFEVIEDTISYEDIFALVKRKMNAATPLLETLCESIIRTVHHEFKMVKEISVTIYKLDAPIENLQGKVGVSIRKNFED